MEHGNFTELAKSYHCRPGYSRQVVTMIAKYLGAGRRDFSIVEVGAGTGKLTGMLIELGFFGIAVEPNDAMRAEGVSTLGEKDNFRWMKGAAENTVLPESSADWVIMASSFHWTDKKRALEEFHRILKPGGHFTAMWNPRDLEKSPLQKTIENTVYEIAPDIRRVSSGNKEHVAPIDEQLTSTGLFEDVIFIEASHEEVMTRERYLGVWRSVNDIQVQAGEKKFAEIMGEIERITASMETITVPYKTRAWTARARAQ